jgi:hypothetical protein
MKQGYVLIVSDRSVTSINRLSKSDKLYKLFSCSSSSSFRISYHWHIAFFYYCYYHHLFFDLNYCYYHYHSNRLLLQGCSIPTLSRTRRNTMLAVAVEAVVVVTAVVVEPNTRITTLTIKTLHKIETPGWRGLGT